MIAIANDFHAVGQSMPVSTLCRVLELPRSTAYYKPKSEPQERPCDPELTGMIYAIIQEYPAFGVRRVWEWLRYQMASLLTVRPSIELCVLTPGRCDSKEPDDAPESRHFLSSPPILINAGRPILPWSTAAMMAGVSPFLLWIAVPARSSDGLEPTARTKTAARAFEEAFLTRFGWTHGAPNGLMLRHDNGLVFGSKTYRLLVKDCGISQEYTAPYTPEQNGLCERFIRSFKEECAWINSFASLAAARAKIAAYIHHYNHRRPHQASNTSPQTNTTKNYALSQPD